MINVACCVTTLEDLKVTHVVGKVLWVELKPSQA